MFHHVPTGGKHVVKSILPIPKACNGQSQMNDGHDSGLCFPECTVRKLQRKKGDLPFMI